MCGGVGGVGRGGVPPRTHVPTHRHARHVAEHIAALRGEEPQSHHTLALETLKRALLCGDKEYEKRIVLFLICLFRSFAIRCKEKEIAMNFKNTFIKIIRLGCKLLNKAGKLLTKVFTTKWDIRFSQIEVIALEVFFFLFFSSLSSFLFFLLFSFFCLNKCMGEKKRKEKE